MTPNTDSAVNLPVKKADIMFEFIRRKPECKVTGVMIFLCYSLVKPDLACTTQACTGKTSHYSKELSDAPLKRWRLEGTTAMK